ncbi:hypothetical protein OFEAOIEE_LOCUS2585 [Methylorubrum extorquens]
MQDHRPIALPPLEEGRDLIGRAAGRVRASGPVGSGIAGDAPAPRVSRLRFTGSVRVRKGVAPRHIHHHEGIEHHREATAGQLRHQPPVPGIGRRTAIGGRLTGAGDGLRRGAVQPGNGPGLARRRLRRRVDPRRHGAVPGAQIVAEPACHHRDALEPGAQSLERIERGDNVTRALKLETVCRLCIAESRVLADGERVEAELGGARYQADCADLARQPGDGADHLEGELRNAVAEGGERQPLEHDVGKSAIGRRVVRTFLGDDQRIGCLRPRAGMNAPIERRQVEFAAIGPDPADQGNLARAQPDGEIDEGAVGGAHGFLAACPTFRAGGGPLHGGVGNLERARRPNQGATDARPAVDTGHRRALGGGEAAEFGQPRPVHEARARAGAEQRAVERRAPGRAGHTPDHPTDGAAERSADCLAGGLQDERRHGGDSVSERVRADRESGRRGRGGAATTA